MEGRRRGWRDSHLLGQVPDVQRYPLGCWLLGREARDCRAFLLGGSGGFGEGEPVEACVVSARRSCGARDVVGAVGGGLVARQGLTGVRLVISDAHSGLAAAAARRRVIPSRRFEMVASW